MCAGAQRVGYFVRDFDKKRLPAHNASRATHASRQGRLVGSSMLVCLERPLTQEVIRAMAALQPPRVVVLDAGFINNGPLKTNAVQVMHSHGVEDFRTV